jgi:hypothetical protein
MIVPVYRLDSEEHWLPVGVEDSLAAVGVSCPPLLDGQNLNLPPSMKQPEQLPAVTYHRCVEGGGLYWHQFWTWWLYNPKKYAGTGNHEGDWEMVQLGCVDLAGDDPILMTCSQHGGGEKREYWRVELASGVRPIVYVARDSHANYFAPHKDVTDIANGTGIDLAAIQLRDFEADWMNWMGRWGNSTNSPGPLTPRRAWRAPHAYHSQARD